MEKEENIKFCTIGDEGIKFCTIGDEGIKFCTIGDEGIKFCTIGDEGESCCVEVSDENSLPKSTLEDSLCSSLDVAGDTCIQLREEKETKKKGKGKEKNKIKSCENYKQKENDGDLQLLMEMKKTLEVENDKKVLESMKEFVDCLCDVFKPNRQSPLGRYKRLIKYVSVEDTGAFEKFKKGFTEFFSILGGYNGGKNINENSKIFYNTNIFLPIGKMIKTPEFQIILKHLNIIHLLMFGDEAKISETGGGKEDELINSLMDNIVNIMENVKGDSPEAAMQSLLSDGKFISMFSEIKNSMENGDIDGMVLFSKMQSLIPKLLSKLVRGGGQGMENIFPLVQSIMGMMNPKTLQ